MPAFRALGQSGIDAVIDYLRTLQGQQGALPFPGDPGRGKSLFFGEAGCARCHIVSGAGGFIGADLSAYARTRSINEIRAAITEPNKDLDPRERTVAVITRDGREYSGIARNEDNFSLQLQSVDGTFHLFTKSDLANLEHQPHSLMPSDYGSTLSKNDVNDLVSYLMSAAGSRKPQTAPQAEPKRHAADE